ncbi:metabolite transporter (DMT) superfamily [Vibrio maritimus]|uniref:Metabolite transporter (DMT) superfamily n=1 Tax=Vibrio maritimus TaxID=990268 RepID=A0A090S5E8_9VIBR|nr:metabolite transporter (DMT) superfamily [Vibrio maritimus]
MNNTLTLSFAAMTAFAFNSLLCRLALGTSAIDPLSFTSIRLVSGAATLVCLSLILKKQQGDSSPSLKMPLALGVTLFGYALSFSLAYITLDTGTGALILFGTVQFALILHHRFSGHKLSFVEMIGIAVALGGFVLLMLPSASQPSILGALLMMVSGLCWSGFTLLGKKVASPITATRQGFVVASILVIVAVLVHSLTASTTSYLTLSGSLYALLSGVVASALGTTSGTVSCRR